MPFARLIVRGLADWAEVFDVYCAAIESSISDPSEVTAELTKWEKWLDEAVARAETEQRIRKAVERSIERRNAPDVVFETARVANRKERHPLRSSEIVSIIRMLTLEQRRFSRARTAT